MSCFNYFFCLKFILLIYLRYSNTYVISNHSNKMSYSPEYQVCSGSHEQIFKNMSEYLLNPCLIKVLIGSFNYFIIFILIQKNNNQIIIKMFLRRKTNGLKEVKSHLTKINVCLFQLTFIFFDC